MAAGSRTALALCLVAGGAHLGCGGSEGDPPLDESAELSAHWSYEGESGPERWGQLDGGFEACASGTQQSPIDIPGHIVPGELSALAFDYSPGPATIVDNGHTIQVNLTEGASELRVGGDLYSLVQFHFHAHSEHAVGGVYLPLEVHLVHRSESGALAVVGVFLDVGSTNSALSPIFADMQHASPEPTPVSSDVDPADLLPSSRLGWAYAGSLTTPPCTEGVRWHVVSSALHISAEQLAAFTSRHPISRRPVTQNGGTVTSGL